MEIHFAPTGRSHQAWNPGTLAVQRPLSGAQVLPLLLGELHSHILERHWVLSPGASRQGSPWWPLAASPRGVGSCAASCAPGQAQRSGSSSWGSATAARSSGTSTLSFKVSLALRRGRDQAGSAGAQHPRLRSRPINAPHAACHTPPGDHTRR